MPFYPGALRAFAYAASGALGEILDVRSQFAHSSDIDRTKGINWKRRVETCGEIGVMGDLGMHVAHVPLRLGFRPETVYAMLDNVVTRAARSRRGTRALRHLGQRAAGLPRPDEPAPTTPALLACCGRPAASLPGR